jgi:SAM-dependent methyltransferase
MLARADAGSNERAALTSKLRCPSCGGSVTVAEDEVECTTGGHRFPIVDGVLVLIEDEGLRADPQYLRQRSYFDAEFTAYTRYRLAPWRVSYLQRLHAANALRAPVIDVGVGGSGYTVIEAARAGSPAVGCDLSLAGLIAARRFAVAEGVEDRTLWICCSAEKLPFADSAFASGLAIAVIEHVPDAVEAVSELARVLEKGGRAWITVPHALPNITAVFRPANRRHDRRLGHLRRYEADELAELGARFGLDPAEVHFTGHPIKVLQLIAARLLPRPLADRLWWWCERRDLRESGRRRGSMQLSVLFTRA